MSNDPRKRHPAPASVNKGVYISTTATTLILLDGGPSQDTWATQWLAKATKARPRPTRDSATRHPCQQAAFFLLCASRPPDVCRLLLVRPRLHHGARDGLCDAGFTSMPTGSISPRLHPATGLRHFSLLLYGFYTRAQFFLDRDRAHPA
jgi:hypothetical protein